MGIQEESSWRALGMCMAFGKDQLELAGQVQVMNIISVLGRKGGDSARTWGLPTQFIHKVGTSFFGIVIWYLQ